MSTFIKTMLPRITFIIGLLWVFFEYFISIPGGPAITATLGKWVVCVANFALLLGALNLIKHYGKNIIQRKGEEWIHGIIILFFMAAMFLTGWFYQPVYLWLYSNFYMGLQTALMCYVGFYFYSAMYKTFKVRSFEAALTLTACITMLLANAPISGAIWGPLPQIGLWIANVPGSGAWRGFLMSAALGMFAVAIRAMLGLERAYMGGSD
jgi:hypothetical protein